MCSRCRDDDPKLDPDAPDLWLLVWCVFVAVLFFIGYNW